MSLHPHAQDSDQPIAGCLTRVDGVYASAIAAGIKPGRKDLSYIYVPDAQASAGVFTKNAFAAACVAYSRECLERGPIKAVVINAGNANAATGELGLRNAQETAEIGAQLLGLSPYQVAVASTGIIGKQLPMDLMRAGLQSLLANPRQQDGRAVAEAIMTTDLVPKEAFRQISIDGGTVTLAGIAKGSGMIAPNMATMLGFVVSDVAISQEHLQPLFRRAISRSFNMISVDTDTSTNDMVLHITNGKSGVPLSSPEALEAYERALTDICIDLAKQIARDGEGATKLISAHVTGAHTEDEAQRIALSIINSPLVKTAIHGADPNWGRVAMAIGKTADVHLQPDLVCISFAGFEVFRRGAPLAFDREAVRAGLSSAEVLIAVDLGLGTGCAYAWGCDLTKGYIDINVDYN